MELSWDTEVIWVIGIVGCLQFDPKYELASMIDQSSASYESAKILCGAHVAKNIILAQRSAREKPKSSSPSDSLQNLSRRKFFTRPPSP